MQSEWNRISKQLRDIRLKANVQFSESQAELFDEFLEHNELGLAFMHLCETLGSASSPITRDVYELIINVASRMNYEAATYEVLERLIRESNSN